MPAQGPCSSDDFRCLCSRTLYVDSLACCISNSCNVDDDTSIFSVHFNKIIETLSVKSGAAELIRQTCAAVNATIPDYIGCAANADIAKSVPMDWLTLYKRLRTLWNSSHTSRPALVSEWRQNPASVCITAVIIRAKSSLVRKKRD